MSKRSQVTVPVPPELKQFLEQRARLEDRTVAALARHLLAEAARRQPLEQRAAEKI